MSLLTALRDVTVGYGQWWRIQWAARRGAADAQFQLGIAYSSDLLRPRDETAATRWFRRAAEQGDTDAQVALGASYANGIGITRNDGDAVAWFRRAAEQEDAEAQFQLGVLYATGRGVGRDDGEAVALFQHAAAQGHAYAQINLARMSACGRGIARDRAQAIMWYCRAAKQGSALGQTGLRTLQAYGLGVPRIEVQVVEWFRRAAEQGNADAQVMLGVMYEMGQGVERDDMQAVHWYRRAADQGDAAGQSRLGTGYASGAGVERNTRRSAAWFRQAAEQGDADAQFQLGNYCFLANGVEQETLKWFRAAAEQGSAEAQFLLGSIYSEGIGVELNDVEAVTWFRRAADQGVPRAREELRRRRGADERPYEVGGAAAGPSSAARHGKDVRARDAFGRTALHHVRNLADAEELLRSDADVRATDCDGRTPLHEVVTHCGAAHPLVRVLVAAGADPEAMDRCGILPEPSADKFDLGELWQLPLYWALGFINRINREALVTVGETEWQLTALHCAAAFHDESATRYLLTAGADVNARNHYGASPLHWAATSGADAVASALLAAGADVQATDLSGWTPLHLAARRNSVAVTEVLLSHGADIEATDRYGDMPLHRAAAGWDAVNTVTVLLEAGADIEARNRRGLTVLHCAALANAAATVQILLMAGADADAMDDEGRTPLALSAQTGAVAAREVLGEGTPSTAPAPFSRRTAARVIRDVRARYRRRYRSKGRFDTPSGFDIADVPPRRRPLASNPRTLHQLLTSGNGWTGWNRVQVGQALLGAGADATAPNDVGDTALHVAAQMDDARLALLLRNAGADAAARNAKGETPRHVARAAVRRVIGKAVEPSEHHEVAVIRALYALTYLLAGGAAGTPEAEPSRLADVAADALRTLLIAGVPYKGQSGRAYAPEEASRCSAALVDAFLVATTKTETATVPLQRMSNGPSAVAALRSLLEAEDEVALFPALDGSARGTRRLVHHVAQVGPTVVLQWLLEASVAGVDVTTSDDVGTTPLHVAADYGNREAVEVLLSAGANIEAKHFNGRTPLHGAAENGHTGVVEVLLRLGANVEARNAFDETPLWMAALVCTSNHRGVAEALLKAGADVEAVKNGTVPALAIAVRKRCIDIVHVLLDAGADAGSPHFAMAGWTLLHEAVGATRSTAPRSGERDRQELDVRLVQALLAAGADIDARAEANGFTVLQQAVAGAGYREVVELLVKAGADVHATCKASGFKGHFAFVDNMDWSEVSERLGVSEGGYGTQEITALELAEAMVAAGWKDGAAVAAILRGA